ncbi:hypothetical protein H4R34_003026 [Dimargaris verticillata]|uniref:Fe2OG dioxygenase domain-containing protein n=1 Tax=Dimargaris verticillata TaxID=2761393 RepID=A0A9W8ECD6_9FUNG|nr:hypothetical protein H4R34_003026 [Dimargaris verticillata]
MANPVPIVDYQLATSNPQQFAQEVGRAFAEIGFMYLRNPSLSAEETNKAFKLSAEYFALPLKEKRRINWTFMNQGYSGVSQERLDPNYQKTGGYKETFNITHWSEPGKCRECPEVFLRNWDTITTFQQHCQQMCVDILRGVCTFLEISDSEGGAEFFTAKHDTRQPSSTNLRFLHYPPMKPSAEDQTAMRAGSHADYGSISLLFQKEVGGLQVYHHHAAEPRWVDVPPLPNCIVVNIGDTLDYWSNGYLKSTQHRVVFPDMGDKVPVRRYSIAYFCHANDGIPMYPLPSPRVQKRLAQGGSPGKDGGALADNVLLTNEYSAMKLYAHNRHRTDAQLPDGALGV